MRNKLIKEIFTAKRYFLLAIFVSSIIINFSSLMLPRLVGNIVDGFEEFRGIIPADKIILFLILLFAWLLGLCLLNFFNVKLINQLVYTLRQKGYEKIFKLPILQLDSWNNGEILSRLTNDLNSVKDGLNNGFFQALVNIITIIASLSFIFVLSWQIGLAVLCLTPVSMFISYKVADNSRQYFARQQQIEANMTTILQEDISHQFLQRILKRQELIYSKYIEANQELAVIGRKAQFISSLTNPGTRFINNLTYITVGLIAALLGIGGSLSYGKIIAVISYTLIYVAPINQLAAVWGDVQKTFAAFDRIANFLNSPDEPKRPMNVLNWDRADIEFKNVEFSYGKEEFYKNFNLAIPQGTKVAIVGPTGGGKTTVVNLLMQFYPLQAGKIELNKQDLAEFRLDEFYRNIAMVWQDTWIFNGTVAENIAYGQPEADREMIEKAAKLVHADRFIEQLPNGYDTVLSEVNCNLSKGQKQLLTIARIMLLQPKIIILDEATSNVDAKTELDVQLALSKLPRSSTMLIIAHRLTTIINSDLILYIDNGKILEAGTHAELMAREGLYYRMYINGNENT